jgi:2-iminobutanoate/2-iminopropanoate deaminase
MKSCAQGRPGWWPAGNGSAAGRARFTKSGFLPPAAPGERPALASGAAGQAREALRNLREILEAAGSSLAAVASVTVYIPDVGLRDEVNRVYEQCFGGHRPARAIVPTRELHHGALVEISAIALG